MGFFSGITDIFQDSVDFIKEKARDIVEPVMNVMPKGVREVLHKGSNIVKKVGGRIAKDAISTFAKPITKVLDAPFKGTPTDDWLRRATGEVVDGVHETFFPKSTSPTYSIGIPKPRPKRGAWDFENPFPGWKEIEDVVLGKPQKPIYAPKKPKPPKIEVPEERKEEREKPKRRKPVVIKDDDPYIYVPTRPKQPTRKKKKRRKPRVTTN